MKLLKNARITTFIFISLLAISSVLQAQVPQISGTYLQNEVLYNFESLDEWQPIAPNTSSKFMIFGTVTNHNGVGVEYPSMKIYNTIPEGMGILSGHSTNSLGVKVSFFRRSYNFFDLIPTEQKLIPGVVKNLEVWVWGGNFDYTMEVILSDFRGREHTLSMGTLKYIGWRNLSTPIPVHVPQSEAYAPRTKGLRFMNFRFWSSPVTGYDGGFSVFLDYCKAVTDIFRDTYDGSQLEAELAKQAGGSEAKQYSDQQEADDTTTAEDGSDIQANTQAETAPAQ